MPGDSVPLQAAPSTLEMSALSQRLEDHVQHIAGTIGERSAMQPIKLSQTADYIQQQFESLGYIPTSRSFGN